MANRFQAVYDGRVFCPTIPCQIEPNTRVWITVDKAEPASKKTSHFLSTARTLNLDGPSDWSANLEQYLYEDENHHVD